MRRGRRWEGELGCLRKVEMEGRMGREVGWFRKVEVEDGKGS